MELERKGVKSYVITGLVSLAVAVGVVVFNRANRYINAPISYQDGCPIYTPMIPDTANSKEGYHKAKFGSFVNHCGGFNSDEERNRYPTHFESRLQAGLCKRVVEIPDRESVRKGLANVTKYINYKGTKVSCFNGPGIEYWLQILAFDRDEIRDFEVYEADPVTKEKLRKIEVGNTSSRNTIWGRFMADTCLEFNEAGVGNAKLLRLDITDKKGNKYHSFIELKEKI